MGTAAMIALSLPGGMALLTGQRSLIQFLDPSGDPESPARLAQEILEAYGDR